MYLCICVCAVTSLAREAQDFPVFGRLSKIPLELLRERERERLQLLSRIAAASPAERTQVDPLRGAHLAHVQIRRTLGVNKRVRCALPRCFS